MTKHQGGAAFHRSSFSSKRLFIEAAFHQMYIEVAHSLNGFFIEKAAFHRLVSFIENTLEHAPVSQLTARASRSLLGFLVQELWLIKLLLQHTLPGATPESGVASVGASWLCHSLPPSAAFC
jgi:hypothetical protein